jgi:hypothetical protein
MVSFCAVICLLFPQIAYKTVTSLPKGPHEAAQSTGMKFAFLLKQRAALIGSTDVCVRGVPSQ